MLNYLRRRGLWSCQAINQQEFAEKYQEGQRDFRGYKFEGVELLPYLSEIDLRHSDLRQVKDLPDVLAKTSAIALATFAPLDNV
jgi:hypothetical protein